MIAGCCWDELVSDLHFTATGDDVIEVIELLEGSVRRVTGAVLVHSLRSLPAECSKSGTTQCAQTSPFEKQISRQ
jgi:hypothetical protein